MPSVIAQARAAQPSGELTRERLACVHCGHLILGGSWCNACRAAAVRRFGSRKGSLQYAEAVAARHVADLDECDCGREKPRAATSCSRCAWLDQPRRSTAQAIISFLRTQRAATIAEIVDAVGVDRRNVVEVLQRMVDDRRIARFEVEFAPEPGAFPGGVTRLVYQLIS